MYYNETMEVESQDIHVILEAALSFPILSHALPPGYHIFCDDILLKLTLLDILDLGGLGNKDGGTGDLGGDVGVGDSVSGGGGGGNGAVGAIAGRIASNTTADVDTHRRVQSLVHLGQQAKPIHNQERKKGPDNVRKPARNAMCEHWVVVTVPGADRGCCGLLVC